MTQIIGKLYEKLWRKVGRKTWWQILVGFLLGIICGHFRW